MHTDKFDQVVRSVTAVNGMPRAAAQVFVPQPVMGKTAGRAARLRRRHATRSPAGRSCRRSSRGSPAPFDGRRARHRSTFDRAARRGSSSPTPRRTCTGSSSTTTGPTSCRSCCRPRSAWRRCCAAHQPQARRGRRAHALDPLPRVLGVHGREGRGERGDGRAPGRSISR